MKRYIGAGTRTRSSHNVFGSRNNANSPPPSLGIDIPAYARSMARRYPSDSGLATQRSNDNHSTIALSESTIAPSQREIQSSALEEQMEDVHNTGNNDISEEQVDMELDDEVMENTHTSERGSATDISISTNDGQLWQRPDSQQFTRQSVRSTSARYSTLPPQLDSQAASARRSVSNPRVSRQSQFESGYSSSHQESGGYGANNPQSTAHGAYQQVIEGEYVEGEVLGAANSSSSNALSRRSQSGGRQARSRSNRNNLRLNLSNNLTVGATATRELPLTPITPSSSSQTASLDNTNISVQAILSESSTANRENNRPVSPVSIRRVTPSSSYNQLGSDSARINGLPSQQPQGEANSGPPTTTTSVSILHSNSDISPNNGTLTSNAPAMVAAPDYSSESKSKLLMNPPGLSHWLMQSGIESMAKWEMLTIAR
ncbi:hypothetical protein H4219_005205 [Mycoemilia scoparia]|uniref:Uncharacterized protein n=1 Tax=Mycoemilia scoparia TaxID=417184 RepID=A0A9W8DQJ2_9FUNG|nr:hypothetical protein H4219_005205 [Mycoemilia scoparia]